MCVHQRRIASNFDVGTRYDKGECYNLFIYKIYEFILPGWVLVCLTVCLYPINVKTAEPIRPEFFGTSRGLREGL